MGKDMAKIIANLVAEIVNGPTSTRSLTMTLPNTLVAAAIQINMNASIGEAHFLQLLLLENKFNEIFECIMEQCQFKNEIIQLIIQNTCVLSELTMKSFWMNYYSNSLLKELY